MNETTNAPSLREWVLVPREATSGQLYAGQKAWLADPERKSSTLYRAMVEATPLTTLTEAVAAARAEGVREGLEQAAAEVQHLARSLRTAGIPCDTNTALANSADTLATAIRALIPTPPTTPGGRTDG